MVSLSCCHKYTQQCSSVEATCFVRVTSYAHPVTGLLMGHTLNVNDGLFLRPDQFSKPLPGKGHNIV